MTPSKVSRKVLVERADWIRRMVAGIKALPLGSFETFTSDPRNVAAADSYLRRALEALLDVGRHVLAKAFGRATSEYKEIAVALRDEGVLSEDETRLLRQMAGYRNRLVHFYHVVAERELYEICRGELDDVERIMGALMRWSDEHPDLIDDSF